MTVIVDGGEEDVYILLRCLRIEVKGTGVLLQQGLAGRTSNKRGILLRCRDCL